MNKAYLLTGSNIGDREHFLKKACELIVTKCGDISNSSSLYETAAWGKRDQPAFINQALEIKTRFSATQVLKQILQIEKKMGRIRTEKYDPRIIDIDIIFFNDEIHKTDLLTIPHPDMQNRRFVLMALAEIAAGIVHPVLHKTVAELLDECPDRLEVKRIVGSMD